MNKTPEFRFYPGAYDDGHFEFSNVACSVCDQTPALRYRGSTHGKNKVEKPCVWCVSNGKAAATADIKQDWPEFDSDAQIYCRLGAFNSIVSRDPIPVTDPIDEVLNRTPQPNTWQQLDWPLQLGEPMIFERFVDYASVQNDSSRLSALISACPKADAQWCKSHVTINGDIGVMMFRSLDGRAFRGILDMS